MITLHEDLRRYGPEDEWNWCHAHSGVVATGALLGNSVAPVHLGPSPALLF